MSWRPRRARGLRIVTVGRKGQSLRLREAVPDGFTTRLQIEHDGSTFVVPLPLAGAFQVSNALVAAGLCIATGSEPAAVFSALAHLEGAPGRLERVGTRHGAPIFVDYAHKPGALESVLATLRPYVSNRLIVVFGCGGDRDAGKRPIMGAIAEAGGGCGDRNRRQPHARRIPQPSGPRFWPPPRKRSKSATALRPSRPPLRSSNPATSSSSPAKANETGQIVGTETLHFSDREAVEAALRDLDA